VIPGANALFSLPSPLWTEDIDYPPIALLEIKFPFVSFVWYFIGLSESK